MDDLLAARSMMAFSLGFHIIFAVIGMIMPFFMVTSHYRYLKYNDPLDLELTKMWQKGVAILFATGAVSGTVLSFELGLLWPKFMEYAGSVIGMPFSWEGTAFFLEGIAIGLYIYGWGKMKPWTHWISGLVVGVSGFASGIFILSANSWMNSPAGFDWVDGKAINIDPVAAMFNDAWPYYAIHMQIAAAVAVGFAVAGVHAFLLLRGYSKKLNLRAMKIALVYGGVAAILQPLSGDFLAKWTAKNQPTKLAAMESHFKTEKNASLVIGGIPDENRQTIDYAIKIPGLLSFMAHGDTDAVVQGLEEFPKDEWPPVLITHIAFQVMVFLGMFLFLLSLFYFFFVLRKKDFPNWFLRLIVLATPLGMLALEAGWTVTEVGRQPWIVYGIQKTKDALTPTPGVFYHFVIFFILYLVLFFVVSWLMARQIKVTNMNVVEGDSK